MRLCHGHEFRSLLFFRRSETSDHKHFFYLIFNLRHLETHILYIAPIQSVCERFIVQVCSELALKRDHLQNRLSYQMCSRAQCKLMLREFVLVRLTYGKGGF
jgi:hypothetical protein